MPEGRRRAVHSPPAEAPLRDRDAPQRGQAGGGGQDTGALKHRHNRRRLPPREDGRDAR